MSTLLNLVIAPVATYLVSAIFNATRGIHIGDRGMLAIVGLVSGAVTAADSLLVSGQHDPTTIVGTFLAGLASTFFHQVKSKLVDKPPSELPQP